MYLRKKAGTEKGVVIRMKNKARLMAVMSAVTLLTACGSKEYVRDIKAEKYVTLGTYKGIEVSVDDPAVTDAAVEEQITQILSQRKVEIEKDGDTVETGDTVNIDYAGYKDGVAFEGGTGSTNLEIGSGSFIDGFEDGLIGHKPGETVSLDLTFPDPYQNNPDLAGQPVVFEVTINSFMGAPELNDAFVESLEIEECKTVEEFRDYVRNSLQLKANSSYDSALENEILTSLMTSSVFKELPKELTDRYYNVWLENSRMQASMTGMTLSQFLALYRGIDITTNAGLASAQEAGVSLAEQYVLFQAIADAEGIDVTDEELNEELDNTVQSYGYETVEDFKKNEDVEEFREYLMANKVMEFLKENAVVTYTTPEEENTEE